MTDPPRRRWLAWAALIVGILIGAGGAAWATATILSPSARPLAEAAYTHATVHEGEVGSALTMTALASWEPAGTGANRASGIVTTVTIDPGSEATPGAVLYSVDLRPVVIAAGAVPAFRSIARSASGQDVAQLQQLLATLGLYTGAVDGNAGSSTDRAIRAWQRSLGVTATGVVELGDVIFVPTLPARVRLDPQVVKVGASLAGGEEAVELLSATPGFRIPATDAQAAMVPTGTRVEITAPDGTLWNGAIADQVRDQPSQTVNLNVRPTGELPLCGEGCDQVPAVGEVMLAARVITSEPVHGLVVPSAALVTTASGEIAVVDEHGTRITVTVVASARGSSVIEGVGAGVRVRVPADGSRS